MSSQIDPCAVAAAPALPGVVSNFVDPPTLTISILTVSSLLVALASVLVFTRLYNNIRMLGWSDFLALAALLFSIVTIGLMASVTKTYRHIWDMPACYFNKAFAIFVFFSACMLMMGLFCAKTSIFLLFFSLLKVQKPMRIAIWAGMVFNFLLYGIGIAIAVYYETPRLGETWLDTLDGRTLIPLRWWQVQSGLSVLLDFYIFILPLPTVLRLKMPLKKRILVTAVFFVALLGVGASIASLAERIHIARAVDQTWIASILSLCSVAELNIAIIVGCAPAFAGFCNNRSLLPAMKSFYASLTSNGSTRRVQDAEAASTELSEGSFTSKGSTAFSKQGHNFKPTNSATIECQRFTDQGDGNELKQGIIIRTLGVEQQVVSMSTSDRTC